MVEELKVTMEDSKYNEGRKIGKVEEGVSFHPENGYDLGKIMNIYSEAEDLAHKSAMLVLNAHDIIHGENAHWEHKQTSHCHLVDLAYDFLKEIPTPTNNVLADSTIGTVVDSMIDEMINSIMFRK